LEFVSSNEGAAVVRLAADTWIAGSPEAVFDVIIDLRGQDAWLPTSSAYRGTLEVSSNPARLGTTYREPGPAGTRHGRVTVFERPGRIVFEQPMTLRWGLGTLGVTLSYELTPSGRGANVRRVCTLTVPRHLRLIKGPLARAFRQESARTLASLRQRFDETGDR
jgi:uncharacterized protein YndB with AHSA1/START domain